MTKTIPPQKIYEHFIWNNKRWEGFEHRSDDILICTAYKAGTTWTQRICSLLIFQSAALENPLTTYSPWMEINGQPVEKLHADYGAQSHRRFIKTHTPLDGLPWRDDMTYLFVARDPRDIFASMLNHMANSLDAAGEILKENTTVERVEMENPPETPKEILRAWLTTGTIEGESDGWPFWSAFTHAKTFWEAKDRDNIHIIHYSDLMNDLDGEMRRISGVLGIPVNEDIWPQLVEAAQFSSMKNQADKMAPDVDWGGWRDNKDFFKAGGNGRWAKLLDDEDVAYYEEKVREILPEDLLRWMHEGSRS